METPGRRLLLALLMPLGILTFMAVIIIGTGLLLLELAHAKEELSQLTPMNYIGDAIKLARNIDN